VLDAPDVLDPPDVLDVLGVAEGTEIEVVAALAFGSSCALAKKAPPKIATPAATATSNGNFLLALWVPGVELSPSDSSNHSGFFGVIANLFR
jgi:hypothetical protein